jgi:hypothetical protein
MTVVTEDVDRYLVDVAGFSVMQCRVDYAFTLQLMSGEKEVAIRIGRPFRYQTQSLAVNVDPEARPEELGPVLHLCRERTVRELTVRKDGALEMRFDDESLLSVPADNDYEAWTLSGPGQLLIVSGPGGDVSIFDVPADESR